MAYTPNYDGLLTPSQRKNFTFKTDVANILARKLANGEKLTFQSLANRNWVNKIARTKFGANTEVRAVKDALYNPALTVEGKLAGMPYQADNNHYLTLYVTEVVKYAPIKTAPVIHKPKPVTAGWLSESYLNSEGNIW